MRQVLPAFFAMAARASSQLCTLALTLVATRYLGPAEFGIFALASIIVTLSRTLLYSGPFEFLMRTRQIDRWAGPCLAATMVMALAGCVLSVALGAAWRWIFGAAGSGLLVAALGLSLLPAALSAWQESIILRHQKVNTYYAITLAIEFDAMLLAIAALMAGWGIWALALQIYLRAIFLPLCFFLSGPRQKVARFPLPDLGAVLRWSTARYGAVGMNFASTYTADVILGLVAGPAATGLYRAASRIVTAVADITAQPVRTMAMARLSHMHASGQKLGGVWLTMVAGCGWLGVPALVGLALTGGLVAPLLLGESWGAIGPVIAALCVARALALAAIIPSAALVSFGRQITIWHIQLATTAAIVLTTLLTAPHGVATVALGVAGVTGLSALATIISTVRITQGRLNWRRAGMLVLVPTLALAGAVTGAFGLLANAGLTHQALLTGVVLAGIAGWGLAVLVLRRAAFTALQSLTVRS